MKQRAIQCILSIVLAAFCLLTGLPASAESIFDDTQQEEVFRDITGGHYIKSRQKVEEMLREKPDSIGANFLMGMIFWNGEGNLHRALQYMKKALKLFEAKYCDNDAKVPQNGELMSWHQRLYGELADIYAELDMRELEFETHKKLADLYHAKLGENAVWSMIKLDMFDEAQAISENSIHGQDTFWADIAYNNLVALEDARHRHMASYEMSIKSVEYSAGKSCVVLQNHARALATLMRMEESIQYYLKAATIASDCLDHPLASLALVYLSDGMWQKSISSFTRVKKRKVDKRHALQTEMSERSVLAVIFYAMGFSEKARDLMATVINAPSRLGYNSLLKEQMDMSNEITYFAILHDAAARTKEALDAYMGLESLWIFDGDIRPRVRELQKEYADIQRKLWSINQQIFKAALDDKNRLSFIVPYYVLPMPSFLPSVVDALGRRTAELFAEEEINALKPEPQAYMAMRSVFSYIHAYIAWRDGDTAAFRKHVEEYRGARVAHQRLMDYDIDLMEADVLMHEGKKQDAYALITKIYMGHPSVFRSRDVRLPVRFDDSMQGELADIRNVLEKSTRFEVAPDAPFVISGERIDGIAKICLSSAMGQRYACSSTVPKDYEHLIHEKPHDAEVVHNFLHAAFAPRVDVSQADIHSLDGSTRVLTADEALSDLLSASPSIKDDKKLDVSDLQND